MAKFCVQHDGRIPTYLIIECQSFKLKEDNVLQKFRELSTPLESWLLSRSPDLGNFFAERERHRGPLSNPFALKGTTLPSPIALMEIAFNTANFSIRPFRTYGTAAYRVTLAMVSLKVNNYPMKIVTTKFTRFKFLTCFSERFITFDFYVMPFQLEVWVGLFTTVIVLLSGTALYEKIGKISNSSFSAWLYILANIFEEGGFVPGWFQGKNFYRFVFGSWTLMSVILTNCYNGLMISELNAPHRSNIPESFQDLICQKRDIFRSYEKVRGTNLANVERWFGANFYEFKTFWNKINLAVVVPNKRLSKL